jgi:hypothetical protein
MPKKTKSKTKTKGGAYVVEGCWRWDELVLPGEGWAGTPPFNPGVGAMF